MIEHRPWIPENYESGRFNGQKILIVGHSHHGDDEDDNGKTEECLLHVMGVRELWNIAFFNQIRDYFGETDHKAFWPKVAFFNYAPSYIGTSDRRYDRMSDPAVIERASERFCRILGEHHPDKTFVFSKAIAPLLPVVPPIPLPYPEVQKTYLKTDKSKAPIFLFRHPQYAPKEAMTTAVQAMLAR